MTAGLFQVLIHIGGHLVHIQADIRNLRRINQIYLINCIQKIEQQFLALFAVAGRFGNRTIFL